MIDWSQALVAAIEQEPDEAKWLELCGQAGSWRSCATSRSGLTDDHYLPIDTVLYLMGINFYKMVYRRDWLVALQQLQEIEGRATILLARLS